MASEIPAIASLPALRGRRSLREEITTILRGAVMSGELAPGVVYSAPSLAEQFPVRFGMRKTTNS